MPRCQHFMRLSCIYQLENIPEEFVTPKHSTAYGRLITGTQVEVGLLRFKAGEGAKPHAHPHEQVLLVLSGKVPSHA
jgi:quercetin dioxygenase-like cupin family protein